MIQSKHFKIALAKKRLKLFEMGLMDLEVEVRSWNGKSVQKKLMFYNFGTSMKMKFAYITIIIYLKYRVKRK